MIGRYGQILESLFMRYAVRPIERIHYMNDKNQISLFLGEILVRHQTSTIRST